MILSTKYTLHQKLHNLTINIRCKIALKLVLIIAFAVHNSGNNSPTLRAVVSAFGHATVLIKANSIHRKGWKI